ncbi:MAG TPA: carbamate kinase [Elusimicrobiales bacterium]|nr:carbamate kinase [Elusimicrobiales bacterium]
MNKNLRIFAFGGNEVSPSGITDPLTGKSIIADIPMQWEKTIQTCRKIADIICRHPDDLFILTHGNGPQVGNILLRSQYARPILHGMPLDVCVASTQGTMTYMIAQLNNELAMRAIKRQACGIVTQVVVNAGDPAFKNPAKFIGPAYSKKEAFEYKEKDGWDIKLYKKDSIGNEIWRRVVASPNPLDIVELGAIEALLEKGIIPITVGGGGIPVIKARTKVIGDEEVYEAGHEIIFKRKFNPKNEPASVYCGVEAVIDKDLASALLGVKLIEKAKIKGKKSEVTLTIFTGEDGAKLNYQQPNEKPLRKLTVKEAEKLLNLKPCPFPAGSMGPKIQSAVNFIKGGGKAAYITKTELFEDTLKGISGTTIVS